MGNLTNSIKLLLVVVPLLSLKKWDDQETKLQQLRHGNKIIQQDIERIKEETKEIDEEYQRVKYPDSPVKQKPTIYEYIRLRDSLSIDIMYHTDSTLLQELQKIKN